MATVIPGTPRFGLPAQPSRHRVTSRPALRQQALAQPGLPQRNLCKLLACNAGSFFVSRRDPGKTPGMFITLVLALPYLALPTMLRCVS